MSLDYDLFVLNPENKDSTPEQIRDCTYDAIDRLAECVMKLHKQLNPTKCEKTATKKPTKCDIGGASATKIPPPLIKDEKIRKAVRAWFIACGGYEDICVADGENGTEFIFIDGSNIEFRVVGSIISRGMHTIEELCGDEEE